MLRATLIVSITLLVGLPVFAQRGGGHGGSGHGGSGSMPGGGSGNGGGGMHGGGGVHGGGGMHGGSGIDGGGMHGGFGGGTRGGSFGMHPGFGDSFHGGFNTFHGGFQQPNHNNLGFRNFDRPALSQFDSGYPDDYSQRYESSNDAYQSSGSAVIAVQVAPNIYSYVAVDNPVTLVPPAIQEFATPPSQNSSAYVPTLYVIAFQDNSIRAAVAYWTEGPTLHYVTMDHEQKQAPLASVDRALSERLNGERHVLFPLPFP